MADQLTSRWLVMKFGGTSVSTPQRWEQIRDQIVRCGEDGQASVVVVSALQGITDLLQDFVQGQSPFNAEQAASEVHRKHLELLDSLGLKPSSDLRALLTDTAELLKQSSESLKQPKVQAEVLSMGERMSSRMGVDILASLGVEVEWLDARDLLQAEHNDQHGHRRRYLSAGCDCSADPALSADLSSRGKAFITQGFVASNGDGETVVLGRGGSDTTAAYLAAKLQAERLEIWTDVPGMFSANPRDIPSARLLQHLSYHESQELASMGAKVLHPRCLSPLRREQIPLMIRQTDKPEIEGTLISAQARDFGAQVKAIVQRRSMTLISMEGLGMWQQVGFLADAFAIFKQHGLSIDLISTSEANVTVSLDPQAQHLDEKLLADLLNDLRGICRAELIPDCASVSLVGLGIRTILHKLGPALEVFEQRRIHLVSQAANDLNLTFVVDEKDAEKLVQQLHQQLIPGGVGADSVFGPTWEQIFRDEERQSTTQAWWVNRRSELLELMSDKGAAYVYSKGRVAEAGRALCGLKEVDRVFYAMKANGHPEILRTLAAMDIGIECVSIHEIERVFSEVPNIDPKRILFTPNFAPLEEYQAGLAKGVNVTIDNLYVLENWGEALSGQTVFLRIDPGSGLGHHKMVRTAGANSKFGIPMSDLEQVIALTDQHQIKVRGLHAHTGSGVMHPDAWHRTLNTMSELLQSFPDVEVFDLGGGLGVPDKNDELPLDLAALDEGLARIKAELPERPLEIWIEPGRYLVSQAGVLLLKVNQTKGKGDVQYVGVASGMNSMIRPALYGAYHEIYNLNRLDQEPDQIYNVVGPICETGDILGTDRLLPRCQESDVLLLANAGAYGAVMASQYNLRKPAVEIIVD